MQYLSTQSAASNNNYCRLPKKPKDQREKKNKKQFQRCSRTSNRYGIKDTGQSHGKQKKQELIIIIKRYRRKVRPTNNQQQQQQTKIMQFFLMIICALKLIKDVTTDKIFSELWIWQQIVEISDVCQIFFFPLLLWVEFLWPSSSTLLEHEEHSSPNANRHSLSLNPHPIVQFSNKVFTELLTNSQERTIKKCEIVAVGCCCCCLVDS